MDRNEWSRSSEGAAYALLVIHTPTKDQPVTSQSMQLPRIERQLYRQPYMQTDRLKGRRILRHSAITLQCGEKLPLTSHSRALASPARRQAASTTLAAISIGGAPNVRCRGESQVRYASHGSAVIARSYLIIFNLWGYRSWTGLSLSRAKIRPTWSQNLMQYFMKICCPRISANGNNIK